MTGSYMDNRRKYPRVKHVRPVNVDWAGGPQFQARLQNISLGGVGLILPNGNVYGLRKRTSVYIELSNSLFWLESEVVHVDPCGYRCGLVITRLSDIMGWRTLCCG